MIKVLGYCKKIALFISLLLLVECAVEDNQFNLNLSETDSLRNAFNQDKVVKKIAIDDGLCQIGFTDGAFIHIEIDTILFRYYCHHIDGWFVSNHEMDLYNAVEVQSDLLHNDNLNDSQVYGERNMIYVTSVYEDDLEHNIRIGLSDNTCYAFEKTEAILKELTFENPSSAIYENIPVMIAGNCLKVIVPCYTESCQLRPRFVVSEGCRVYAAGQEIVSGDTVLDFTNPIVLDVISESGGDCSYTIELHNTDLPTLFVDIPNGALVESKDEWIQNVSVKLYNRNGEIDYKADDSNIKGRGNITWTLPKKPYSLKLRKETEMLGMPASKRWVLLANWLDRSLLRNATAFEISRCTDLEWTPKGQFVELVLNGKHQGNYYLCEQIRVGKDRVNIEEMEAEDIDGDNLTGGYLLELDINYDEKNKFKSEFCDYPYMIKSPDDDVLQSEQMLYIKDYVSAMEVSMYDSIMLNSHIYTNYIDVESFVDYWFVNELTGNYEINHPKSLYLHKNRQGKMKAGPVWDFDYSTFISTDFDKFADTSAVYYKQLFKDEWFVDIVKSRWTMFYPKFAMIPEYMMKESKRLKKSENFNHKLWPISHFWSNVNGGAYISYDEVVSNMIESYQAKLAWMDCQIRNM